MKALGFCLVIFFCSGVLLGQEASNKRIKSIFIDGDTIQIDSLSIIPNSVFIVNEAKQKIPDFLFQMDYTNAQLINKGIAIGQTLKFRYRVFPLLFTATYSHKSKSQIEQEDPGKYDYFTLKPQTQNQDLFALSGLSKNGSISRGISFGNNQDLSIRSNLDLQLAGKVTEDISIQAAISDNSIPIQAEGNTQQLQEFDRVFIRLFNENSSLIAGDFLLTRPSSYFMNLNKKVQGGGFSTTIVTRKNKAKEQQGVFKTALNAAISRGKFSRNVIDGIEGNQGPYQLQGAEGESFIIVLSGTEKVYVNGKLLKRGQEFDYTIDYNTAELSFMPSQIITKDKRIVVEFQYAERNYARSLIFVENQYKQNKFQLDFNVYSEQDNKNQSLLQELSDEDKLVLKEAGDDFSKAQVSGIDSADFENDQVRYRLTDSLGFANVLVYSKDPDSAKYQAKFSLLGAGQGNYVQSQSDGNGRVFQWIAPQNGIPQGSYEPVIVLISPKKRQLISLGLAYNFNEETAVEVEGAFSNYDINTFSNKDAADNTDLGLKLAFKHQEVLRKQDSAPSLLWRSNVFYEQIGANFQFIERYRDVEFQRDWNLQGLVLNGNERIIRANTGLKKGESNFDYQFSTFSKGSDYEAYRNGYSGNLKHKGFSLQSKGSWLTANSMDNNEFIRHYTTLKQKVFGLTAGAYLEQERILFYQGKSDSIKAGSFDRLIWRAFIEQGDSSSNTVRLGYSEIYDYFPIDTRLSYALKSENMDLAFNWKKSPKSNLKATATYRKLKILNSELSSRDPENTLLGQVEYNLKAMRGFISSNTFYQIGSGLEYKREFSFLNVNDGLGTHVWIDFNDNGIKELNEFEAAGANNAFRANYIKVFTPTSEFVRVFSNQFNQVFLIKPAAIIKSNKGWKKYIAKFSNKLAYRSERKLLTEENSYDPLFASIKDSNLISLNSSFSNTLYFNRLHPNFGMDYYFLNNSNKNLLINGFERRDLILHEIKSRYNLNSVYSLELRMTQSERRNSSEFFANRNYTIESAEIEPRVIFQPSVSLRLSLSASYSDRSNQIGSEKAILKSSNVELNYNQAGKGTFLLGFGFVQIDFNEIASSSLSFEMLDGLQNGNNITWNTSWQRNLSDNLQLSINYTGRKSDAIRVIHTGGMQLRAYF